MTSPILFGFLQYILGPLIFMTSVFLIMVVLVQRGRGGGLTGALGGAGGQSAFGAKAGDVFTKITIVVAVFWILLCILATMSLQDSGASKLGSGGGVAPAGGASATPGMEGPALTVPSDEEGTQPADEAAPADKPAENLEPPAGESTEAPAAEAAAPATEEAPMTEEKPAS
ncbi:preprotein translocase subunit SecG [Bremerella sp. JC817]|uniref:preprotein translocase subunit SecG n=1 Tax=Bremerella sp. JC817 TaxID=3231756 RepID=UPI00345ABC18